MVAQLIPVKQTVYKKQQNARNGYRYWKVNSGLTMVGAFIPGSCGIYGKNESSTYFRSHLSQFLR